MVKISNTMSMLPKVLVSFFLCTTLLFPSFNTLKKAVVKNGELNLLFSKPIDKKSIKHFTLSHPNRDIYDFKNTRIAHKRVPLGLGEYVRVAQYKSNIVRVVITSKKGYKTVAYQPFFETKSYHISVPQGKSHVVAKKRKRHVKKTKKTQTKATLKKHKKRKTVHHAQELIVIDAGHGGHDTGAIGGGKREKDLVLQIAKKVEKSLKKLGYPVYMTRRSDRFLKLPQRTRIADKKKALVFVSIHANSVPKKIGHKVKGVETFFLQNTRDAKSQRIAARENKAVLKGTTKLSQNVIIDSVLAGPKIVESNKLAIDVQRGMITELRRKYKGVKDSGVRHAPFWVLVGASRPSILVEVGYISNPTERKRLFSSQYQALLAKGIAEGIDSYLTNRKREIDLLE